MEYKSETTGAKIVINPCSLVDAFKLKAVVEKALLSMNKNLEDLFEEDVMAIIVTVDSSQEVFDCVFDCLKNSIYNGVPIKPDVFDDLKAREDFYDVVYQCIKVNLTPFFKKLLSELGINVPLDKLKGALKQRLTTSSDSSVVLSQGNGISAETQKE